MKSERYILASCVVTDRKIIANQMSIGNHSRNNNLQNFSIQSVPKSLCDSSFVLFDNFFLTVLKQI